MARLLFVSRHAPTLDQERLARELGFDGLDTRDLSFDKNPLNVVRQLGLQPGGALALVGPLHTALTLLRAGYLIVEFPNAADARARSAFVCAGAYRHTLERSQFTPLSGGGE